MSIIANLLASIALLIAFESIAAPGESTLRNSRVMLAVIGIDPGLLIVIAIGFLVVAGNVTAQLETNALRAQLLARANALTPARNRQERQRQTGYLATLRPLYGALLSLSVELPRFLIFAGAALFFFPNLLGIWLIAGVGIGLVLTRQGFRRGARVFQEHRGVRSGENQSAGNIAESLINVESNASVLPVKSLGMVVALALAPFVASWFLTGTLTGVTTAWIPVWLLLISSFVSLVRLSAVLGLAIVRNGEFVVVDREVIKRDQ